MAGRRRAALGNLSGQVSHAGLWLDVGFDADPHEEDQQRIVQARNTFTGKVTGAVAVAKGIYGSGFRRWEASLISHVRQRFKTRDSLAVGLGAKGVLETGLRLHHTYGVPVIPGSSLKGLCASYCAAVWGKMKPEQFGPDTEFHSIVFGTKNSSGVLVFEDALILPESVTGSIQQDVMTPHYTKTYYGQAGSRKQPPTGTENPVPVQFLSVKGTFLVAIGWRAGEEHGKGWADLSMKLLTEAARKWGVGGKTRGGYGRMVPVA